jgi:hypothetical protein
MYILSDKISYINFLFTSSLWLGIFNGGLKNGRPPLADRQTPRGSSSPFKELTVKEPRVTARATAG